MGLDGALEKLLPELIQPEFTAQMEAALDTIAQGKQDWQGYLTAGTVPILRLRWQRRVNYCKLIVF
jgi:DNA topoisomerase IA